MTFWRKEDPVLDDDGQVIKGGMWSHQRQWWDSRSYIKALVTGYGGGKTFIGAKRAISMALHNANEGGPCPYMIVSPSHRQAKRTIVPALVSLLNGRNIKYRYNKTDLEFAIYRNGKSNIIWIGSGDNPDALKGPNLCGALIDEPFIQPREVFNQMLARVRDPKAKHREIGVTGTPEELNWGYDICAGDEAHKYDIRLIQAHSRANKALPKQYIESLESGYGDDEKMVAAYVGGEFVNLSKGLVYYGFSRERHVMDLPDPGGDLYLGMDFNVNPMAAVVFWVNGQHMHYIDEIELANSDTAEMVNEAQRRYPGRIKTAFPDPSGNSRKTSAVGGITDFAIIRQHGLQVKARPHAPTRRDRYNAANVKFSKNELTLSRKCKRLARYFEQLAHETFKKQEDMTHLTDGATYPVEYLFPIVVHLATQTRIKGLY